MKQAMHENFEREEPVKPGSQRSFGIVMAAVFGLLSLVSWWHHGMAWHWMSAIAAIFLIAALVVPAALKPLNWLWFKIGMLLHAVVSPLVMGLMFYLAVLPTGLVMRALGNDLLRLKHEPDSDSYWIVREPAGSPPETMKDQF
jgi:hypothetical protein